MKLFFICYCLMAGWGLGVTFATIYQIIMHVFELPADAGHPIWATYVSLVLNIVLFFHMRSQAEEELEKIRRRRWKRRMQQRFYTYREGLK